MQAPSNDSLTTADRLELLRQRMHGNDTASSNAQPPPDSSNPFQSATDTYSRSFDGAFDLISHSPPERSHNMAHERKLKEEFEGKLRRLREFAIDVIRKYATAKKTEDDRALIERQVRLGTLTTSLGNHPQWAGGCDIDRADARIEELTKKISEFDTRRGDEISVQRKAMMKYELKEQRALRKQLDDERREFAILLRIASDRDKSAYKPGQLLDDGKFILVEFIGRGGFSEVWLAAEVAEARYVAIKIQGMNPQWPKPVQENFTKHIGRELKILRSANHENVVEFFGHFFVDDNTVAMVMEYCSGGDLAMMIKKRGRIPEREARAILMQTVNGLLALRNGGSSVIHYDLKPANILFNDDGVVKITDFGLSKVIEDAEAAIELTSRGTGTYYYAAPETFQKCAQIMITSSVDTWSLGVIFYEMLFGQRPFGEDTSQQVFAKQIDTMVGAVVFPTQVKVTDGCKEFIKVCLDRNPQTRPELKDLARHAYLSDSYFAK